MDLDDLKNTWQDANKQVEEQQKLTPEMIDQVIQKKYSSNLSKIAYPEVIGVIICMMSAIFIGLNFYKLDTVYLQSAGILSILLLLILSIVSLFSIQQFNKKVDLNKSYSETLKKFAVQKIQFHKFQKVNVILCYLLLVTIIVLLSKFFNGKDISQSKYYWTFSFTIGYLFLLFYSRWVAKYYHRTLQQTGELLKELQ